MLELAVWIGVAVLLVLIPWAIAEMWLMVVDPPNPLDEEWVGEDDWRRMAERDI